MSEHIVHTVILNDSLRLIHALDQVSDSLKQILRDYEYFALRGCTTVSGDSFSYRLLDHIKGLAELKEKDRAILAFTLGWVSHRACDRVMKPIWKEAPFKGRGTDVDPNVSPFECSIYHEAEAFRRYLANGTLYPLALFPDKLNEEVSDGFDQSTAEELVEGAFAANMMQIQTIPDDMADQQRFEEICMRVQKFYVGLHRYRRAIAKPDAANQYEFVQKINWYHEEDPIIRAANQLRSGIKLSSKQVMDMVNEGGKSYFAKALTLSVQYILSAERYVHDEMLDITWLREQLDIGKLGPGGLAV